MRQCGASEDDMRILIARKFIIIFESGVIVIKHWRINNYLRSDRYTETKQLEEKSALTIGENGAYHVENANLGIPVGIPHGIPSIGKDRLGKDSINNIYEHPASHPKDVDSEEASLPRVDGFREVEEFYNTIWKLYPKKKGKGQVSKSQKTKLFNLGYDVISKCVDRYVKEFSSSGKSEQYMMYGSTFFNSGYVDYLDENYGNDRDAGITEEEHNAGWQ